MKTSDKFWNILALLIIAPMIFIVVKVMGFLKFFLIYGGGFVCVFLFCLFLVPKFTKLNSYYERNKLKKYRVIAVFIFTILGVLSGILYIGPEAIGLFPGKTNDVGYSLFVFGFLGFVVGYILSKVIKTKQGKYYF